MSIISIGELLLMMPTVEKRLAQAELLCQKVGARLTAPRKALLALIYSHPEQLTAYELLRLLRKNYPKAEAMMVYRGLDFLQKQQLVHRIASQNTYTACDTPQHRHHSQLLLCEQCGYAQEINATSVAQALQEMAQQQHFVLSDKPIELTGICQDCHSKTIK